MNKFGIDCRGVLLLIAMLLATRWIRREAAVWGMVIATLLLTWWTATRFFPTIALMGAITLTLHALRKPRSRTLMSDPPAQNPYRTPLRRTPFRPVIETETVFGLADKPAMARLLTGAVFALYFSIWSRALIAGAPGHMLPLDVLLTLVVALALWKGRVWFAIAPATAVWLHLCVDTGVVTAPVTMLQWGVSLVGGGFALLALSLAANASLPQTKRSARLTLAQGSTSSPSPTHIARRIDCRSRRRPNRTASTMASSSLRPSTASLPAISDARAAAAAMERRHGQPWAREADQATTDREHVGHGAILEVTTFDQGSSRAGGRPAPVPHGIDRLPN